MKSKLSFIIVTIATVLLFNSCKKYEDGANFSIYTKKHRVVGDWNLVTKTYNSQDLLAPVHLDGLQICNTGDTVYYTIDNYYDSEIWSFKRDGTVKCSTWSSSTQPDASYMYLNCQAVYSTTSQNGIVEGTWEFSGKKEDLTLLGVVHPYDNIWEIIELREDKMKLKITRPYVSKIMAFEKIK